MTQVTYAIAFGSNYFHMLGENPNQLSSDKSNTLLASSSSSSCASPMMMMPHLVPSHYLSSEDQDQESSAEKKNLPNKNSTELPFTSTGNFDLRNEQSHRDSNLDNGTCSISEIKIGCTSMAVLVDGKKTSKKQEL